MRKIEINGNLENEVELDFNLFYSTINKVLDLFFEIFKTELENPIDLLIDNALTGSGPTPIITPVLNKYLVIKLSVSLFDTESRIAFQFSHEIMHYVFYVIKGIDKSFADSREESICSAASLITIKEFYPGEFELYREYLNSIDIEMYRHGAKVAEEVNYSLENLKNLL